MFTEEQGKLINPLEATADKLFLLSLEEATNSNYGFETDNAQDSKRIKQKTDYSQVQGSGDLSTWWLRTAKEATTISYLAWRDGTITSDGVTRCRGVCPSLYIML